MPQPTYPVAGAAGQVLQFGGAVPERLSGFKFKGKRTWSTPRPTLDLNDRVGWRVAQLPVVKTPRTLRTMALPGYQERSVLLDDVFHPRTIKTTVTYNESASGVPISAAKANLMQYGENWLTIDGQTRIKAIVTNWYQYLLRGAAPWLWGVDIEWTCLDPWFQDITATTVAAFTVQGGAGGANPTFFNFTYAGSVKTDDIVWTLHADGTQTQGINFLQIFNPSTVANYLQVNFNPVLPSGVVHDVVIDQTAGTAVDNTTTSHVLGAGLVKLWPPAGINQAALAKIWSAADNLNGLTLAATYRNRWDL